MAGLLRISGWNMEGGQGNNDAVVDLDGFWRERERESIGMEVCSSFVLGPVLLTAV